MHLYWISIASLYSTPLGAGVVPSLFLPCWRAAQLQRCRSIDLASLEGMRTRKLLWPCHAWTGYPKVSDLDKYWPDGGLVPA